MTSGPREVSWVNGRTSALDRTTELLRLTPFPTDSGSSNKLQPQLLSLSIICKIGLGHFLNVKSYLFTLTGDIYNPATHGQAAYHRPSIPHRSLIPTL